jgi:type VI secretion system secreted protein VgrG
MDVLATIFGALGAGPKQHERLLRLHTPLGPEVLVAESLDGVEALAPAAGGVAGYRLELTALSVDAHLDLAELLGQPVLLQLQTAASAFELRPFHGHVTAFERVGSNGGLARYRLVVEPWLALLRQRVDSYVFPDMTVVEIVESVFADYASAGRMVPAWRWELADRAVYRKRSLTTQYEESDLAFIERLLADEGLFYWVEHDGAPGDDSLGAHTVVIADHNDAFADAGAVRFHRSDVTERDDSIQHWSAAHRWQTGRLKRASWDYRRLDARDTELDGDASAALAAEDSDIAGQYAWPDRATGERFIERQLEALQVSRWTIEGLGSWRQLRAGAGFALTRHPVVGANGDGRFHCIRIRHRARNNLGAEVLAQVEQQLGRVALPALPLPDVLGAGAGAGTGADMPAADEADVDFYRNRFEALPAAVPFRARTTDGHGLRLHPKPTVHGTQTAVVVSDGAPLQTDRDHRIKVQFPWQRGANAGNRQPHPAGDDNAPADAGSWTWVRVAGAWAGDNWGCVLPPRKGQEVLVAFLEGDIDRPVVVGTLYNGRGQVDAPHNQVGAGAAGATGNAPAWFDGNGHGAVFTGFKSQALADSQSGSGGFQQLRLDDTPGQGRAQAGTTQRDTTLTLGHLKGGRDNVRTGERGFGAELSTAAGGALRAGAGLLLSTERGHAQLDASGARAQLAQGGQLVASLDGVATAQGADLPGAPSPLPAGAALDTAGEHLAATASGSAPGNGIGGGEGEVPAWTAPMLVATSPDGIASLTPADQVWVSGEQTTLTAGQDLQWLTQGASVTGVSGGIALYAHGSEPPAGKPNTETGIALHAAQGTVSARAPSATAEVAALTSVRIASTNADVQLAAPNKHLLATTAGAYIKLEGGNIEIAAPGTIEFKAAKKEWTSGQRASGEAPELAKGDLKLCDFKTRGADAAGDGAVPLGG